jgi:hypothetical protein
MSAEITTCSKAQDALLECFMTAKEGASLSADLRFHLEDCAACRQYWYNLGGVRSSYPPGPLYSPFLRAKTLHRLANRDQAIRVEWLPLVVLASLFSLSISYLFPAWLVSKLLIQWTSSTAFAFEISLGIVLVIGVLVTMAAAISLYERGYFHLSNGNELPYPTKSGQ